MFIKGKMDFSKIDMEKVKKRLLQLGLSSLIVASLTACSNKKEDSYSNVPDVTIETSEPSVDKNEINVVTEEIEEKPIIIIEDHADSEEVFIPNFVFLTFEEGYKEGYTYADLKHVKEAEIMILSSLDPKEEDYDFLNYMPNLKKISFTFNDALDINLRNAVDFSRFTEIEEVSINSMSDPISKKTVSFLKDFKHIDTLEINSGEYIYLGKVNADNLRIEAAYGDISFDDLSTFKKIEINMEPYDSAICFDKKIISDLRNKGVNVIIKDEETFNQVNDMLDSIIDELNITSNMTEEEKTRKIVTRVMEMSEYDPEVSQRISEGKSTGDLSKNFYKEGALYPVLESDTQICGNYASITTALGRRTGLEIYNVSAPEHVFNLVKIGDYYYSLDVTWLDSSGYIETINEPLYADDGTFILPQSYERHPMVEAFQNNIYDEIYKKDNNYLFDPTDPYNDPNGTIYHKSIGFPKDIEIMEIPDDKEIKYILLNSLVQAVEEVKNEEQIDNKIIEDIPDLTEKEFKIKINGKIIIIPAAVLVGLLIGLGVLKRKQRIREDARKRRRRSSSYDPFADDYNISLDGDYISSRRRRR